MKRYVLFVYFRLVAKRRASRVTCDVVLFLSLSVFFITVGYCSAFVANNYRPVGRSVKVKDPIRYSL